MRLRAFVAAVTVAILTFAGPAVAVAQDDPEVISVSIVSATVDMETGVPTVIINVSCLMDAAIVRGEGSLTQASGKRRFAYSLQGGFGGGSCVEGNVLTFTAVFGHQAGRFAPGPATLEGFVEAMFECCSTADLASLGPTTVLLRPA